MTLIYLKPGEIKITGLNPRKEIDINSTEFTELVNNIREHGVLSPVSVNQIDNEFFLICGERRLTACLELHKENDEIEIPAQVYQNLNKSEIMQMMLSENLHRKDMDPFEEAEYLKMQLHVSDDYEYASKIINKPVSYIQKRLSLLNLIKPFQKMYLKNQISIDTCLFLARYSTNIQKEAFDNLDSNGTDVTYAINDFTTSIRHNTLKLSEAPFDLNKVFGKHGACSSCPYNTESAPLLFDLKKKEKGQCMKSDCYENKLQIFFLEELKKACDDESIVLIANSSYMPNSLTSAIDQAKKLVKDSGKIVYQMYTDYSEDEKSKVMGFDVTGKSMKLIPIKINKQKAAVKAKMDKSVELTKDDKNEMKKQIREKIKRTEELKGEKLFEFIKENFNRNNFPHIEKIGDDHLLTMMLDIAMSHGDAWGLLKNADFEVFEKDTQLSFQGKLTALKPLVWLFMKTMLKKTGTVDTDYGAALYTAVTITASDEFKEKLTLFRKESEETYSKKKDRLNERLKEIK